MSKTDEEKFLALVGNLEEEGQFEWKVRIDAIFAYYYDNCMLKDGVSFGGKLLNLRSTLSGFTTVKEDQWLMGKYFQNYASERDDVFFDCEHLIHHHEPERFQVVFSSFNKTLFELVEKL